MAEKRTHAEVHYRIARSDSRRCGMCSMFVAPDDCTHVVKPIARGGVCDDFAGKGSALHDHPRSAARA